MKINNSQINNIDKNDAKASFMQLPDNNSNTKTTAYNNDSVNINRAKRNDDILFVGMNKDASYELKKLREDVNGSNIKILSVTDRGFTTSVDKQGIKHVSTTVKDKLGNVYNLGDKNSIRNYVKTFGLPQEQSEKIVEAIDTYDTKARDELAKVAEVWLTAEKGGTIPSRLILSGHSTGNGVFGDDNGEITFDSLDKLADAMPKAAAQIEDLHISGCYAGGQHNVYKYRQIFPNLKTSWGYTNSAPGAVSGAETHQRAWEKATRSDTGTLNRDIVSNTRKGDSVAVWSTENGYNDGRPVRSLQDVMKNINKTQSSFDSYYSGDEEITDPYSNDLRDFYDNLQDLIQHPDLPADKRKGLEELKEQTIRLIFFNRIENSFAKNYSSELNSGFKELNLKPVNFRDLSRKEAMDKVAEFEEKYNSIDKPSESLQNTYNLLTTGLRELDSSIIPQSWI